MLYRAICNKWRAVKQSGKRCSVFLLLLLLSFGCGAQLAPGRVGVLFVNSTPAAITWDNANRSGSVTLSAGNLTASGGGTGIVLATVGKSSGKWYWEIVINSFSNWAATGVGTAAVIGTGGDLYSTANGYAYATFSTSNSYKATNNGFTAFGAPFGVASVIGLALDMGAGTLAFYLNGALQGTAFTGLTGTIYPADGSQSGNAWNHSAHFATASFVYSPPAGFIALTP
jgi:hypothetical protein